MGIQSAQEAFDLFEEHRAEYLAKSRLFMRMFARDGRTVTVNDLIEHGPRMPEGVDPRVRGAVFIERDVWERLGYTGSRRKKSHGRQVMSFRLL